MFCFLFEPEYYIRVAAWYISHYIRIDTCIFYFECFSVSEVLLKKIQENVREKYCIICTEVRFEEINEITVNGIKKIYTFKKNALQSVEFVVFPNLFR